MVEAIGYVSGGILAVCLVPQIYQVWKTRSAEDISYWWSFLYFLGTVGTLVYMVLVNAVAGWVSGAIETVMLFVLVGIKWWYDRRARLAGDGGEMGEEAMAMAAARAAAARAAPSVRSHRSASSSTVKYPGRVLYAVVDRVEDEDATTVHSGEV
ncbi:hypothetical protein AMAG_13113 [Allomyces macrogynus ATCC 38327]|uniref:Uncharacterized protein n=1 Tax=Allomyces macrogynus (strain ATCC 38327) TaxID=578462 RepID=A0A0L0SZK4_ALLM3|nr:hypothetical protein AMAG_13113 [Allomyces macrogynus ATCC 38327]|eukprot:KNE67926.1 hypothetical protein AMAG_13113 [Allomyces macrogynus ATCC 38327]